MKNSGRRYGARTALGLAGGALLGLVRLSLAAPAPEAAPKGPALDGNRAPYAIAFSRDGTRAFVTEMAEGSVAVVDALARKVVAHWPTGGERPAGLALTPDGREVVVTNSLSGSVSILSTQTGQRRALVPLPGMPYGVRVSPDGTRAFVSVSQLDQVAVLDLKAAAITARIAVGRRPRALDLTPDGKTLIVANLTGGTLSVVDTATLKQRSEFKLKGTNVRGVQVTADGEEAYATLMPPFNGLPAADPKEVWHNLVQAVRLTSDPPVKAEDQWMDFARVPGETDILGSPDQHDLVLDKDARYAWIAVGGRDVVTRITIHDTRRIVIWPFSQQEVAVGANPRGLALSPNGKEVWVANHLGNSLTVLDADSPTPLATIPLGDASRRDPTLLGQYLFNHAGMTRMKRFTCASCHPDGLSDGLTWRFVHVDDGVDRRNSRDLRGGLNATAPFRWSGHDAAMDTFLKDEVTGLLGGNAPTPDQLTSLKQAIESFPLPPNPYRAPNGAFTAAAKRGEALFVGKAACAQCHLGPAHGGTGLKVNIGTRPAAEGPAGQVDVPHLRATYDSAPYLHDGRASTLEEVFTKHNAQQRHGKAHVLTPAELADLLRYVREL